MNVARLRKVWALTGSAVPGEAAAAREQARKMVEREGLTLADVPRLLGQVRPAAAGIRSFGDYMEEHEPGWKAAWARQQREQQARDAQERAAIVRRYGGEEAALAPTPMERAVDDAVARFRRTVMKQYANGSFLAESLDGWHDTFLMNDVPARVREAIEAAMPLPLSIPAAKAEHDAWEARHRELDLLRCGGDFHLSLACEVRRHVVRKLLETGLRATSLEEVLIRQRYFADQEVDNPEIAQAVLADLERLVEAGDA